MACVYIHKRKDTGAVFYIGISVNNKRPYNKSNRNVYWKRIESKYGRDVHIISKNISLEKAKNLEKVLIWAYGRKDLGNGVLCNMTNGGDGTFSKVVSRETRYQISKGLKGNTNSKNSVRSESFRRGVSEEKSKKVLQFDLNSNLIKEYNSLTEASAITGATVGNINKVCNNIRKTAAGFIWKYK